MSFCGKITTVTCRIDFRDHNPFSKSDFRTIVPNSVRFVLRKDSIGLILATCHGLMLMYPLQLILCMLLPKKKLSQSVSHSIVSASEV